MLLRFRDRLLAAVEESAPRLLDADRLDDLLPALRRALALDPLREGLVRLLQESLDGTQAHRRIGRKRPRHERPDGLVFVGLHDVPAQPGVLRYRHKILSLDIP